MGVGSLSYYHTINYHPRTSPLFGCAGHGTILIVANSGNCIQYGTKHTLHVKIFTHLTQGDNSVHFFYISATKTKRM